MTTEAEFKAARTEMLDRMRRNAANMDECAKKAREKGYLCRAAEHEAEAAYIRRLLSNYESKFRSET